MRLPALYLLLFASVTTVLAQAPQTNRVPAGGKGAAVGSQPEQKSADANGVDTIISLVKANMSEALVLKTIQRQNKAYDLTPDDLVKLQKAGVSETIINAMLDPSAASAAAPVPAAAAPAATTPLAPAAPKAASAPAASAPASRGASAANAPAAGCPQQSSTAAPAPTQQAKGGVFSSFKDKLKGTAQKTVDGLGDTLNCAVDSGVQTSQSQVSSAVDNAAGVPAQKVADVGSAGNKAVTTNTSTTNSNTTGSAAAAQPGAKKSSQK
jgi:hypothetical protein